MNRCITHHAGRKACVSPDTAFQGFPAHFHQDLPTHKEFHHEESVALNTHQGKEYFLNMGFHPISGFLFACFVCFRIFRFVLVVVVVNQWVVCEILCLYIAFFLSLVT